MNESISKVPKPIPALHLYPYTYAADDIARDMEMSEAAQRELLLEMARAILAGKLRVRNPETGAPVHVTSSMVNPYPYVMVTDVNEWLEKEGRFYKWIPLEIALTEICDLTNNAAGSSDIPGIKVIPGRMPRTGKLASVHQVFAKFNQWILEDKEPILIKVTVREVAWMTSNNEERIYTHETCGKTLKKWNSTRP
jgi:hypothetical protein